MQAIDGHHNTNNTMNDHHQHHTQSGDLETIELQLDENGSPVPLNARAWYVCFVPGLIRQWWHRFVHERHKHVFAMRPAGPGCWTLFEPWWHRLLTTTITSEQARKFLLWGARGDVLCVRESVPGHGSQIRGWMTCAALASYLLGRRYWVWTPHGLYKLLLREPNVCRVDVARLVKLNAAQLAKASEIIMGCDESVRGAPERRPGAPKPFCMNCGRDLVELPEVKDHLRLIAELGRSSDGHATPLAGGVEHART
jgi:hypothetical protein